MEEKEKQKLLLKIVIGSAWVDSVLEPSEVKYLESLLDKYHLHLDSELKELLKKPVPPTITENWIIKYLKDSTTSERLKLLSAIGNMLMADRNVTEVEHALLDEYHELMGKIPANSETEKHHLNIAETIGGFVKKIIKSIPI